MNPLRDWYCLSTLLLIACGGLAFYMLRPWQAAASRTFQVQASFNGQPAWSGQARSARFELDGSSNLQLTIQTTTGSVHLSAASGNTLTLQGIAP